MDSNDHPINTITIQCIQGNNSVWRFSVIIVNSFPEGVKQVQEITHLLKKKPMKYLSDNK